MKCISCHWFGNNIEISSVENVQEEQKIKWDSIFKEKNKFSGGFREVSSISRYNKTYALD